MGKVYIRKGKDGEFENINFFTAYIGFKELGFEIMFFKDINELLETKPEDIIVGYIGEVRKVLQRLGVNYPELNYPTELRQHLGREIWQDTLGNIINNQENWGIFVKPSVGVKQFTGVVIDKIEDIRAVIGIDSKTPVWYSETVDFVSEWRCFIRYGIVESVKQYNGDWGKPIDYSVLRKAVEEYKTAPNAYVIDLGVTSEGETLLVEVNEGYSVGCYGLDPVKYAKFLSARWSELTQTEDLCNF